MKSIAKKISVSFIVIIAIFYGHIGIKAQGVKLQRPMVYKGKTEVVNWLMSEKLDGIRGYWNGKQLMTRKGKLINAPKWFLDNFPSFELDGELWSTRNDFEFIQSTVLTKKPSLAWEKITYNIFEVPNARGDFKTRLQKAKKWFSGHPNDYVSRKSISTIRLTWPSSGASRMPRCCILLIRSEEHTSELQSHC